MYQFFGIGIGTTDAAVVKLILVSLAYHSN